MTSSIVVFDTEYTTWDNAQQSHWGQPGQLREVVQIGAIKWKKGESWEQGATFERIVRPLQNPKLSDFFIQLTNITQQQVDENGVTMAHAMRDFTEFVGADYGWANGSDMHVMAETCGLQGVAMQVNVKRFGSLHAELYAALNKEIGEFDRRNYPSGKVCQLLGLNLNGHVHDAMFDVKSLCATIAELQRRGHTFSYWDWP